MDERGWRAVEILYHAYLTGLILYTVTRRGARAGADLVFWTYRRQHLAKFLPGLQKLALLGLPHAVACARYHYLSNFLGGVRVEYAEESARKAWIRYPPPRWIWQGTAVCGIPSEVSRAMLRGWHAHNGVTLGSPRLAFVCTKQTVDGQPGLEGYYVERDAEVAAEERLVFAPGERAPEFDSANAPRLPSADWPPARLAKARRNYAMDYAATILPEAIRLFGPAEGGHLAGAAARLIGMQYYAETAALAAPGERTPEALAEYVTTMGRAQGDDTAWEKSAGEIRIRQSTWRLMDGVSGLAPEVFDAWSELWRGAALAHDPRLVLDVVRRFEPDGRGIEWRLTRR